jgi:beta-lactamase regulating signal transducer with metallopeptidase domain
MSTILEQLASSWFALGLLKSSAIALMGGTFIFCLRQRDLASGLWAGLALLLPLAAFSGLLPLSWKALPPVVEAPAAAARTAKVELQVANESSIISELPDEVVVDPVEPTLEAAVQRPSSTATAAFSPLVSREQGLTCLWIAGGAVTLLPGLLTLLASRRLRLRAAPDDITARWDALAADTAKSVRVWISPDVTTPGITSVLRPRVVLPESSIHWESGRMMSVLHHELHHLERHDLALRQLGGLMRAVLWFHPASWWVHSRLVLAQERAADFAVVAAGVSAADYAGHLLEAAAESRSFPGIAMARRSQVGGRIRGLLARREPAGPLRVAAERSAAVLMGASAMILAVMGFSSPEVAGVEVPATAMDKGFRAPILDRHGKLIATSDPARMPEALRADPPIRWYPEGAALGHVSGFALLHEGKVQVAGGSGLEDSGELAKGKPLRSTIDIGIQRMVWNELAALKMPGSVVVMDPRSGEVLAMASWPSIDPNDYSGGITPEEWKRLLAAPGQPLIHRALAVEPPGSFAKLVVALAAADADMTDRIYFCDGSVRVGGHTFHDHHSYDKDLNLGEALMKLPNSYFIRLAVDMGGPRLHGIWDKLRLPRSAELPWPMPPALWCAGDPVRPNGVKWQPPDLAIAAIGYGQTRISLLDAASIMATVASGVVREPVFLLDGKAADPVPLEECGIDARELVLIRQGLLDIVGPGGTASRARLDGIRVAGIPGTTITSVQAPDSLYQAPQPPKRTWFASFTGYAPAEHPRYVVAARIENGGSSSGSQPFSGGTVAAPLAANFLRALLAEETE